MWAESTKRPRRGRNMSLLESRGKAGNGNLTGRSLTVRNTHLRKHPAARVENHDSNRLKQMNTSVLTAKRVDARNILLCMATTAVVMLLCWPVGEIGYTDDF